VTKLSDSSVSIVTRLPAVWWELRFLAAATAFLCFKTSRPATGHTQCPVQWLLWVRCFGHELLRLRMSEAVPLLNLHALTVCRAGPSWSKLDSQLSYDPVCAWSQSPLSPPSLPFLLPVVQCLRYSVPGCGAVIIKISSWLSTSKFCPEVRPGPASLVGPRGPKWSFELGLAPRGPTRYLWLFCVRVVR
jgi:hypothetical protein